MFKYLTRFLTCQIEQNLGKNRGFLCKTKRDVIRVNSTKKFLQNVYEPIEWPPQSPDLNPIENLWSIIKMELCKRREEILNQEDCWNVIKSVWKSLDFDLLTRLYQQLPGRMACSSSAFQVSERTMVRWRKELLPQLSEKKEENYEMKENKPATGKKSKQLNHQKLMEKGKGSKIF
jgi:hypothetical protein